MDRLAAFIPKIGRVTAAIPPSINDGANAMVIMTEEKTETRLKAVARIKAVGTAGATLRNGPERRPSGTS